ncbi:MAG: Ig-like domain-containing protein [Gammaproteobacteria bacterium]|nr:Ig-like domain-containing protein [Gammaproteobacteria bacterium]
MRKAIFPLLSLLLLGASNLASGLTVTLLTDNTRSSSGTLSFQAFKTCDPAPANGCYNPANSWNINNSVTGSDATWDWNPVTKVLTSTGTFWTTSFLSSNPSATSVISDKTVDLTINTTAQTTTATSYNCIEGNFLAGVGANGCLNLSTGNDFVTSSTALYNVGGDANCVQRTILGDDVSTGNPRGLFTADAVGACDAVDGAYDLYTVVSDDTATGGNLIISNGIDLGACLTFGCPAEPAAAGAHWLTFAVVAGANDDGPFDVQQQVAKSIDVLANDSGFNDPVTVTVSTPPAKGTAVVVGTSPGPQAGITIEYTANGGATGADTFVYTVQDAGTTDTATVSVNILAFGANDDTATTRTNSAAIDINVGANDAGFTDPVTITITAAPDAGGTATPPAGSVALANGIISYTPAATAPGTATYTETFTYQVTDAVPQSDTAVVTVTVTNAVPDAVGGATSTISTQGSAPAGKTGTFTAPGTGGNLGDAPSVVTVSTQGTKGNATVASNVITYTITDAAFFSGADVFSYTITDADGETDSADVTVTIPDLTPSVAGDPATSGNQDTTLTGSGAFTAGNGSVAQHALTVQTQAASGTCVPSVSGSNIAVAYTPNAGFTGNDSCVVRLADGEGDFGDGTYSFTVNAAGGGGGGGGGANLPSSSGFDLWSLSLLAGISWLRRRRLMKPRSVAGNDCR